MINILTTVDWKWTSDENIVLWSCWRYRTHLKVFRLKPLWGRPRAIRSFINKRYRSFKTTTIEYKTVSINQRYKLHKTFPPLSSRSRSESVDFVYSGQQSPLSNNCSWNQKPSASSSDYRQNTTMHLGISAPKPSGVPAVRCCYHNL